MTKMASPGRPPERRQQFTIMHGDAFVATITPKAELVAGEMVHSYITSIHDAGRLADLFYALSDRKPLAWPTGVALRVREDVQA